MTGPRLTAQQFAAAEAWDEVDACYRELRAVLPLQHETRAGNAAAWDCYRAWQRAVERAKAAQQLADHDGGAYNAFDDEPEEGTST